MYQRGEEMNARQRDELMKTLMAEDLALCQKKGSDYAPDEDCLANLKEFGLLGIIVRLSDKFSRLKNLVLHGKVPENESVEDTLRDIRIYCYLAQILNMEKRMKTEMYFDEKTIYIAGPLTPRSLDKNHALEYLENRREMIKAYGILTQAGWCPFCPAFDEDAFLVYPQLTIGQVQKNSLAYLKRSDAVLFLPGWEKSPGARAEFEIAVKLGKKIFYSLEEALQT